MYVDDDRKPAIIESPIKSIQSDIASIIAHPGNDVRIGIAHGAYLANWGNVHLCKFCGSGATKTGPSLKPVLCTCWPFFRFFLLKQQQHHKLNIMGFSSATEVSAPSSSSQELDSPRSPSSGGFPLLRTGAYKYLPAVVTASPMDSLASHPSLHSEMLAKERNNTEESYYIYTEKMWAHAPDSPSYHQTLSTIAEDEQDSS